MDENFWDIGGIQCDHRDNSLTVLVNRDRDKYILRKTDGSKIQTKVIDVGVETPCPYCNNDIAVTWRMVDELENA